MTAEFKGSFCLNNEWYGFENLFPSGKQHNVVRQPCLDGKNFGILGSRPALP